MPKIIKERQIVDDSWKVLVLAENETPETLRLPIGPLLVPLAVWQARKMSPSGVQGSTLRPEIVSQNSFRRGTRFSGWLPAMMAELMAPMETPEIQLGSQPASASAS